MSQFRADLHCHSTCSDGTYTPAQIVRLAAEIGLQGLSITDHDTLEAYSEAVPEADKLNIKLISGVELSAVHQNVSVHILAYGFSLDDPVMQTFCREHSARRENRYRLILDRLALHGMPIEPEEVIALSSGALGKRSIGRPHIALAMVNKGYVKNIQEAFRFYLAEESSCYVRGPSFSVEDTLDKIRQAKGLAVLAHPHLIPHQPTLLALLKMPFDGMECYYAKFHASKHERWIKIAEKKGWLITGGSDFHGSIKPHIPLGCSWVNEETFELLRTKHVR